MCIILVLTTYAMLHTHLYLLPKLRKLGAMPPLHPMPYWRGDLLSTGTKLHSLFLLNLV